MRKNFHLILYVLLTATIAACTDNTVSFGNATEESRLKIELSGDIEQVPATRVNDNGFVDGDVMGVYIVDYNGSVPGTLMTSGNRGDNVQHTFDEANYKWNSAYDVFWKDKHTHIDVYGYYPFGNPESIEQYAFTVQQDQSMPTEGGTMGGYEASDFLWGKAEDVAPTTSVVRLSMYHRMANARVTLVEGTGFADGEWASTDKQVTVANVVREASINLADGTVMTNGGVEKKATIPARAGDEWRAIVVPQTVAAGTTMFSITVGGIPYKFSKGEAFTYLAGKMSNFAIRVDKKEASGQYALTIISESITAWENDLVSHDATAKEYVVIHSTAGHLKDAIAQAGKDYKKVKNLKITGQVNSTDFLMMRDSMPSLTALNLKNVRIKAGYDYNVDPGVEPVYGEDDEIPYCAFFKKSGLNYFVFPDTLKRVKANALAESGISGSLIIPEGVEEIEFGAFGACKGLTGTLSLPSTLKRITGENAFVYDKFTCELVLPEGLEEIGTQAFLGCTGLYGNLRLPETLKYIGSGAFKDCYNLSGDLEIPQSIEKIHPGTFSNCSFGGNLKLHDGIVSIGENAFSSCFFKGELTFPKDLVTIENDVFYNNDFSGELKLPSKIVSIGDRAFAYNWRLMGTIEFPEDVISIGAGAFAHCRSIEGLVFPAGLENIRYEETYYDDGGAFEGCYGIGSIVCKGEMPPYVQTGAFNGVAKDNFTLEVPE
ncbi:MAG: leucine-rich repeat protein, partial [Prevotella sp.]